MRDDYTDRILDQIIKDIKASEHWTDSPDARTDHMIMPRDIFIDMINTTESSAPVVLRGDVMSTPEPDPETVTIKLKPKRKKKKSRKEIKRNRKATRLARKWNRRKRSKRK